MSNIPPPETIRITSPRVACDGAGVIDAALGHPRVYLHVDDSGYVDCGYCDRRFVLAGGPADVPDAGTTPSATSRPPSTGA